MSVTIESLDIQIRSSAGSAAANIDKLAESLGRLRGNAKLTAVSNNLERLAGALSKLEVSSTSLSSIKGLAGAMKSLAGVQKSSGLNSTLNSLKKLPEIVNNIDPSTLDAFAVAMRKLSDALAPLAKQLDKIGTGFAKLPAKLTQCVSATNKLASANNKAATSQKKHTESLDKQSINLAAVIANIETYISFLNQIRVAMGGMIADAMEWDGIQFRFGRAFGEDAEEVYAYAQKVSDVLKINIQQFMQYSSLYGSLLSGFGLAQEKVTTISVGLTELSYDIWAAYNDRFKTLEDASEAVRSAITGEIEPIRNAGIALTEASMQEYLDSVGMAHVSIEKLTEAQKAEVRYAVMVNAAMNQGIVGTYAREMQTAEGAVRTLTQQMKTLGQAVGSIFIPLISAALPYISAFVEILYDGVAALAAFLGIPFFEIQWDSGAGNVGSGLEDIAAGAENAGDALGETAKAAKKLKDYTMGFDELNVISPPDASSGSGGSGGSGAEGVGNGFEGLDLKTLWDDSVFASASKQVDELKAKILGFFEKWKTEIAIIGGALGAIGMAKMLGHLGEALELGESFLGVMKDITKLAATAIIITLQYSLMTEFLGNYIDGEGFKNYVAAMFVGAIGTGVLYSMWGPAGLVIGLGVVAAASLSAVIDNGGINSAESAVTALTGLAAAAGAVAIGWKKMSVIIAGSKLANIFDAIKTALKGPQTIFDALKGGNAASSALTFMFPNITKVAVALSGAAKAVGAFVAGISAPVWGTIVAVVAAIAAAAVFLARNWDEVVAAVMRFFETNIEPKLENIRDSWEKMKQAVKDALPESVIQWFKDAAEWVGNLIQKIGEWFKSVDWLGAIGKAFEVVGGIIVAILGGAISGVINAVVGLIDGLIQTFSGVVQVISGVVEFVAALVTGGDLVEPWEKIKKGIVDIFVGLYKSTIGVVVEFVKGIIGWFVALWDELVGHSIVPDTIDAIVDWFLSLPKKIFGPVEDFVKGIIKRFKDMWTDIKSWFNTNVAPKFTKDYWKTKFDGIKTGLKAKLDDAWKEVKDFFSATEWKKKVDEAVEAIKKNFKMPSLPKIKLEVTWSTNVGKVKTAVYEALGLDGWPSLKWSSYATGGFPGVGEMFIARESGPELVGRIGNRSTVANNDQIVEGITAGVYQAVVAAMSQSGGGQGQSVNVYLDGKQIYASIKKTESERGMKLMGNQLGYAY